MPSHQVFTVHAIAVLCMASLRLARLAMLPEECPWPGKQIDTLCSYRYFASSNCMQCPKTRDTRVFLSVLGHCEEGTVSSGIRSPYLR
jgi:hypothetical protein